MYQKSPLPAESPDIQPFDPPFSLIKPFPYTRYDMLHAPEPTRLAQLSSGPG